MVQFQFVKIVPDISCITDEAAYCAYIFPSSNRVLTHMWLHSEAPGVNICLCVRVDVRYMFTSALHNRCLCLSPFLPLAARPQTHCGGCEHVRPLAVLSLLATLHNDGSGALVVNLEQGRIRVHMCVFVYLYNSVINV